MVLFPAQDIHLVSNQQTPDSKSGAMSVRIKLDAITDVQARAIQQELNIQLKKQGAEHKYNKDANWLCAYSAADGYIELPFMYAHLAFTQLAIQRQAQMKYAKCPLVFAGKLRTESKQ